ncbi:MAG: hypothetical protein H6728_13425 [Myxococcales bacterium]|nr:hypothetical protein [Myxococcales bacterium]MCB9644070.1 hypothetical protein [Myxococcales bacterium]
MMFLIGCPAPPSQNEEPKSDGSSNIEKTTETTQETTSETAVEPVTESTTETTLEGGVETSPEGTAETTSEGGVETTPEGTTETTPEGGNESVTETTPEGGCNPGDSRACYTGPTGTEGVGACKGGFQLCLAGGAWSACQSEVLPGTAEICGNKIDDNCDGKTDAEDGAACACNPGETRDCYTGPTGTEGVGVCKKGTQTCDANSTWQACQNEVLPGTAEICGNKLDDNCDGKTDTEDTASCECDPQATRECYAGPANTKGVGACKAGTETCGADGKWGNCQGDVSPQQEICDGIDNNCNGTVDEETAATPLCGVGQRCVLGKCACDATSCPTGCCNGDQCIAVTSDGQCGTAGAACAACAQGNTCNNGVCVCNAVSCPNGCCDSQGKCQVGTANNSCGKNGVACANCPSGQACDPQSQVCGCGPNTCATGCCSPNGQCTAASVTSCGVGGNACVACDAQRANVCDSGTCKCGTNAACAVGQRCSNSQCVCDATSCPNGCCDGNKCITNTTTQLCADGGAACKTCDTNVADNCTSRSCSCGSTPACTGEASCKNGRCVCEDYQVSNVSVDGKVYMSADINVVSGGNFNVKMDYKLTQVPGCPTCTSQLVVGIYTKGYGAASAATCVYNGQPEQCPKATGGNSTVSIATPLTPGTYEVRIIRTTQFNCADALAQFNRSTDLSTAKVIATVKVTPPATCRPFEALLSSVSLNNQGNEITVAPGVGVTLRAGYQFSRLNGCLFCNSQIVGGFLPAIGGGGGAVKMGCFYNGTPGSCPNPTTATNGQIAFTAPSTPGIYHIRYNPDSSSSCNNASFSAGRTATIGVLRVQ